jgi:hypothetical protein
MQTLSFNNGLFMQIKTLNFRGEIPNSQPCIAAHLQGAQNPAHKANLAKELQSPTHSNQLSLQKVITNLYCIINNLLVQAREKKGKDGASPHLFLFQVQ